MKTSLALLSVAACLLIGAPSGTLSADGPPQQTQTPTPQFRAGTDLVAVDFQVVDESGRPITDLKPGELALKVDGRARDIKALQFVKVARSSAEAPVNTAVASQPLPFASNDAVTPGRIVIIVVDHEHLRAGEGKAAIDAAGRLVESAVADGPNRTGHVAERARRG